MQQSGIIGALFQMKTPSIEGGLGDAYMSTPSIPDGYKKCSRCGEVKPITEFHKEKSHTDGLRSDCKACNRKRANLYRNDHLEQTLQKNREWRTKHPEYHKQKSKERHQNPEKREQDRNQEKAYWETRLEEKKAKSRRYYARHKTVINSKQKQARNNNPEKVKQQNIRARLYYHQNSKAIRSKSDQWRRDNPDKILEYHHRRRARKLSASGTAPTNIKAVLYGIQNGLCLYCQAPVLPNTDLDHILPLSLADLIKNHPGHSPENLALACDHCNSSKHNNLLEDWLAWKYPDQMDEILLRVEKHIQKMKEQFPQEK